MAKATKASVVGELPASEPAASKPPTEASAPPASTPVEAVPSALVLVRILSRLKTGGKRVEAGDEAILAREDAESLAARGIVELLEG